MCWPEVARFTLHQHVRPVQRPGECNLWARREQEFKPTALRVGNIRDLWADGVTYQQLQWVIQGGDTVMVAPIAGGYNTGLISLPVQMAADQLPGQLLWLYMPTVPSGSPTQHTRILGYEWANCHSDSAKTTLVASYGATGINVPTRQFVDVACFDSSARGACSGGYTNSCTATSNAGK